MLLSIFLNMLKDQYCNEHGRASSSCFIFFDFRCMALFRARFIRFFLFSFLVCISGMLHPRSLLCRASCYLKLRAISFVLICYLYLLSLLVFVASIFSSLSFFHRFLLFLTILTTSVVGYHFFRLFRERKE
jgi:hypothetical protein